MAREDDVGQNLVSFKSEIGWRGKSWSSTNDRGERRLLKLENGYVATDGSEIRSQPGMVTLIDLSAENNENGGYGRYTIDAVRPIFSTTPNEPYQFGYYGGDSNQQTLYARALPTHLHGFDQIGKEIVVWGESRFREQPLYDSTHTQITVTHVGVVSGDIVFDFTGTLSNNSVSDAGASLNGIEAGDVVYAEGLTVADSTLQAFLDANVNKKYIDITGISSNRITCNTALSNQTVTAVTAGTVHRVRPNRSGTYIVPQSPYAAAYLQRIDDPDSLTAWRILDQPDFNLTVVDCFPSWVANRRRDFGDQRDANDTEGVFIDDSLVRGRTRREGRELPYRTNADAAADGIVLAAPQYGCMFWLPMGVPTNPDNFPGSPDNNQGGIPLPANAQFDQPRCLGIPKPRMVESSVTPAQTSPSESGSFNFSVEALAGSPEFGFAPGTWTVAISFEDSAMGWEGLASEPVEVEIPNNTYAYALVPHYWNPNYTNPECCVDRINVYLAAPDEDALTFYASFPLAEVTGVAVTAINGTHYNASGIYGFLPMSPETRAMYRKIQLPVLGANDSIEDGLEAEAERLAPQSAQMPRGADAVRSVRGVLFSGGQVGNTGGGLQLWVGAASSAFEPSATYDDDKGLLIRVHGATIAQPDADQDGIGSMPDQPDWTTLGIPGRCFPSGYQGIDAVSKTLFPGGASSVQIDKVMNRRTNSLTTQADAFRANFERLRLTRPIWDRTRIAGSPVAQPTVGQQDELLYYKMFQGQLQIGDPGAPNRTNLIATQFFDTNRGDDITGIGSLAGNVIVCSQRETKSFAWARNASAEQIHDVTNQHGCIAANSMVEFDGGLAWLSEKGPVAIGNGFQFVGQDISEDFINGPERIYAFDSKGMMRHSWGCHDPSRGLVLWGLRTVNDAYVLEHQFETYTWSTASDELKSRFPCDEILCWNYRTNAFSTWRLPLRILWARMIRIGSGDSVLVVLAEDQRIYALLDGAGDMLHPPTNSGLNILSPAVVGAATTTLPINVMCGQDGDATTGRNRSDGTSVLFLRTGMTVEGIENGKLRWTTTIASIESTGSTGSVTLAAAQTWGKGAAGWRIRIGARPRMAITTGFVSGGVNPISVQGVQARYSLMGSGSAHAFVEYLSSSLTDQVTAEVVHGAPSDEWELLGSATAGLIPLGTDLGRVGRQRTMKRGGKDQKEIAVKVTFAGDAQIRLADLALEVA